MQKLLAVDPSLASSGWALFVVDPNASDAPRLPLRVGVICPPGPQTEMPRRLALLQAEVEELFAIHGIGPGDIVLCEGPAPVVLNPDSAIKVEGVRGIFEAVARTCGCMVPGRLNPRTVQSELLGMRGRQASRSEVKSAARRTVNLLFGDAINDLAAASGCRTKTAPQDIIDAVLIGTLAVSRLNMAVRSGLPLDALFASPGGRRRTSGRTGKRSAAWSEKHFQKIVSGR